MNRLWIALHRFGLSKQIINTDLVMSCETDEYRNRNLSGSVFIMGISTLRYVKYVCNLSLSQVIILAKISYVFKCIHKDYPLKKHASKKVEAIN